MKQPTTSSQDEPASGEPCRGIRATRRTMLLGGAAVLLAKSLPSRPRSFAGPGVAQRAVVAVADPALASAVAFANQMRFSAIPTTRALSADQVWFETLDPLLRRRGAQAVVGLTGRATFQALAVMAQDHRLATVLRIDRFSQAGQWNYRLTAPSAAMRVLRTAASCAQLTEKSFFAVAALAARRPLGITSKVYPISVNGPAATPLQDAIVWVLAPLTRPVSSV